MHEGLFGTPVLQRDQEAVYAPELDPEAAVGWPSADSAEAALERIERAYDLHPEGYDEYIPEAAMPTHYE